MKSIVKRWMDDNRADTQALADGNVQAFFRELGFRYFKYFQVITLFQILFFQFHPSYVGLSASVSYFKLFLLQARRSSLYYYFVHGALLWK